MRPPWLFWKLFLVYGAIQTVLAAVLMTIAGRMNSLPLAAAILVIMLMLIGAFLGAGITWLLIRRSRLEIQQLADAVDSAGREDEVAAIEASGLSAAAPLAAALQKAQRRTAQRLRRLERQGERLLMVLDGMGEGVLALDAERRVLVANAASRQLLQIATGNIVGRPLLEIVRSREVHAAVEEALRTEEVVEIEFETTAEPRRSLHLRAKRLSGDPSPGVLLVLDDVSQLRRLESMRADFAANVSHELKTPLASIKAYAETLRLGALNDPEINVTFVERIEEHADRLHYLISDLMHLARVESGKEVFEIEDLPLNELVEDCVDYHRESAEARRIALRIEPPAARLDVQGDEVGVRTILDNLVNNAIKYTPDGGRVEVAWRRDGRHVLLEVRDTGIGIAAENQDRIFERFYRVDKARSREVGGTGLGLSIVKHTAQALGGRVGLESQLGQGSTFRVWLPGANGKDLN